MSTIGFNHYNLRAPRELMDERKDFYCEMVGLAQGHRPSFESFGYWLYAAINVSPLEPAAPGMKCA